MSDAGLPQAAAMLTRTTSDIPKIWRSFGLAQGLDRLAAAYTCIDAAIQGAKLPSAKSQSVYGNKTVVGAAKALALSLIHI